MFLIIISLILITLIFIKLCNASNVFKFYFKYTIYCILSTIFAIAVTPYLLMRPRNVNNLKTASKLFRLTSLALGLKFELRGVEYLKKDYTCVIVANHQSSLDIQGMYELWQVMGKVTVIARMLLLFAGPFGLGAWLCGLIFINKGSPDRGIKKMNDAMEYLKRNKIKLWMYAEGYRNHSGKIDNFKKGAFKMAMQAQVPIVPVVFSSYNYFLDPKEKRFNSGKIIIEALPEIPTKDLQANDIDSLMNQTRNIMIKKFDELNYELKHELNKRSI